jgi:DNA-binding response OmpR family regulator
MAESRISDRPPTGDSWVALATDGPILTLRGAIRTVSDPATFRALIDDVRPRIVVVSEPPASAGLIDHLTQQRRRRPRMRIVHVAADADIDGRLRALRLGFDASLPASIDPIELLGRLELLDELANVRSASCVAVGAGVELDLVAHELRRDGQAVHLRPKEFDLLALLAAHPGRAYTRRQLLDRVWGNGYRGGPRTVDVHVRWLRAKVEADPAHPAHLITLRSIGYRLDPPFSLTEP